MNDWTLRQCQQEQLLADKLGVSLSGTTDPVIRAQRVRKAILDRNLADTEATRTKDRSVKSYRMLFQSAYSTPLEARE